MRRAREMRYLQGALAALLACAAACSAGCRCREPASEARGGSGAGPIAGSASGGARSDGAGARARDEIAALRSLPYLSWVPVKAEDRHRSGVVRHELGRAFAGLNFYSSRPRHAAHLIDMDGRVVRSWSSALEQPSAEELSWTRAWAGLDLAGWHHVHLAPDGSLFAIVNHQALIKLDAHSRLVWKALLPAHHDLVIVPGGDIYTISSAKRWVRGFPEPMLIVDSEIVVLGADGAIKRRLSLFNALRDSPRTARLLRRKLRWAHEQLEKHLPLYYLKARMLQTEAEVQRLANAYSEIIEGTFRGTRRVELTLMNMLQPLDILHANSLHLLPHDVPGLGRAGDLLVAVRELDLVLALDPKSGKIGWSWGERELRRPHNPTLASGGRVLVFDNRPAANWSRVVEVAPGSGEIIWEYRAPKQSDFFSPIRGACQQLPNGNVLITDSERGRVLEVTRDKEVVWEFFNPDIDDPYEGRARAPIYRMVRFPEGSLRLPR